MLLLAVSLPLAAQTPRDDATAAPAASSSAGNRRIDEIMVEGRRAEAASEFAIDLQEFGTQVQLIDAEKLETGGFTNFGEAAAGLIRGANVGYSPDEGEFTIRIDGGTDRDTLLMVDGVPYFDRSSPLEDIWPATQIDPRMIDTIEVYRGGQSLYYGSNAGLGIVRVRTKEPDGTAKGQVGFYGGSFATREIYGNYSFPLDADGRHNLMFYGRSYETDAHTLFDESAYSDNVLALGGFHDFPYSFNSIGIKYLWLMNGESELRLGYSYSNVDFRDSFPNTTVFQPNFTRFPIWTATFDKSFNDRFRLEVEAHYQTPSLRNHEFDARVCNIPRLQDLPQDAQAIAAQQGITAFETAAEFEAFANGIPSLPAGCVTNPFGEHGQAAASAREGIYVNQNPDSPFFGQPYGTFENPFAIGAPMGTVIQSTASFGTGVPSKGFGPVDQLESGYKDYGINVRGTYTFNENLELVTGIQNTSYEDNSDERFGVRDVSLSTTGIYSDLRITLPVLEDMRVSLAGRYDINNEYDDHSFWRAGFRQNMPMGLYVRGSAGTSYSSPKIDEIGAFGQNQNLNPGLEPQELETRNYGIGIDGDVFGATYNVELGYFDTTIKNLFSNRALQNVCLEYVGLPNSREVIEANRRDIIPPDTFCATAFENGLNGLDTVSVNALAEQDIQGVTLDVGLNFEKLRVDLTFTDLESLEPNPVRGVAARLDGTATDLDFVVPGRAGSVEKRQSGERPEWMLSGLITYTPFERWSFSLNPRWQGPEYAYAPTGLARLVDENGNRVVEDVNFGNYFVLNGSIQYRHGADLQHRFLLRIVNLLDEDYFERASGGATLPVERAAVRGEIGPNDSSYYRQYGWNGKPRSAWLQYEYSF